MHKYNPADKYVIYNDSKHLSPIVLKLPTPPDLRLIDGYGKNPVDQVWAPLEQSSKLELLKEKSIAKVKEWASKRQDRRVTDYRVSVEFWKGLDEEKEYYAEEIQYIKKIHYFLYNGYWFYNHGVPTWIPPTYFRYLNFWHIADESLKNNRPDYRDVDRRTYIFKWYCRTTHETLGNLNADRQALKDTRGRYTIIEKPNRTCFGHIKPKRRREGASNQECSDLLWTAERNINSNCVIMADTGQSAKDIYEKYMRVGFLKQPLFLKPMNEVYPNSSQIEFTAPYHEYGVESLGSTIFFVDTADEKAVDRLRTDAILSDESGKVERSDARMRHGISKLTAAQFEKIHGYLAYPSTVEDMNDGGESFKDMWLESDFYKRDPLGHTESGLYGLFWPAWDGMDGYIDKWGYSVIDNPTQEQIEHAPKGSSFIDGVGAKEIIQSKINQFLSENTPKSLRNYREYIRRHPVEIDHCWIGHAGDMGWDIIKIEKRLAQLSRKNPDLVRGNFEWIGGIEFNPKGVEFVQDDINGRFFVSDLNKGFENLQTMTNGPIVWNEKIGRYVSAKAPLYPNRFTIGADSFDYGSKSEVKGRITGTRKSDGGIHILRNYDPQIDGDRPKNEWETFKTVATYRYRQPNMEDYAKDVAKAMIFYGAMLSAERNKTRLWEYIVDWGLGGYMIFIVNPDGTISDKPGIWMGKGGSGDKDSLFNLMGDFIDFRIDHEDHPLLLNEMKDISGPEKLKDYDLLTASMCSLVGAEKGHQKRFTRINNTQSVSLKGSIFEPHRY